MANFKRYEGYVNSVPQRMIDSSLPVCPFCRSNNPHWLLASKLDLMGGRTLYRCERCGATMSGSAIDAAADGGKQFAFNPAMAGLNAAQKGSKGQEVGVSYFKIEELGSVCRDASLLGKELPLPQLKIMSGYQEPSFGQTAPAPAVEAPAAPRPVAAPIAPQPAPQPVQQPVYTAPAAPQRPVYQPQYQQPPVQPQAPMYQQPPVQPQPAPVQPVEEKKSGASIVPPLLSVIFGVLAFVLGYVFSYIYNRYLLIEGFAFAPMAIVFAVVRIIFCIPALVLGIIGLIKSIKAKKIVGIILAAVGLLLSLYVLITAFSLISNIAKYTF